MPSENGWIVRWWSDLVCAAGWRRVPSDLRGQEQKPFSLGLNLDVLWHIFDINADIFDDDEALETTLATSYVCHDWRTLLLNSSSVWAHVISLDHWQWGTVEWNRELIRRSGSALLWIKMHTGLHYLRREKKQIPNVMDTCWDRIQKLEITIDHDLPNQWAPLCRPTLHLESIGIICDHRYSKLDNLWSSLFSGDAPMLRDLCWKGHGPNITAVSWLRQVRCMELNATLTVSAILRVLESTMNLANLRLDHVLGDNHALTLPFVSLPELVRLDLNLPDKLTPGTVLLEHMYIPPSCAVIFSAQRVQQGELDNESVFGPIIAAISTCAQRRLSHHLPQRLQVVMTRTSFLLEAKHCSFKPYFLFHIKMASQSFNTIPGKTHAALLKGFSKPSLSRVTLFEVRMFRTLRNHVPGLAAFIACLPSVDTLVTDKPFLLYLGSRIPPNGGNTPRSIPFPALKILKLHSSTLSELRCKSNKGRDPLSKYIMDRIACGHAISVVNFTEVTLDVLPNLTFLRKANGVKVVWRKRNRSEIQEYTCRASAPRKFGGV